MRYFIITLALVLFAPLGIAEQDPVTTSDDSKKPAKPKTTKPKKKKDDVALAVIVNAKNSVKKITFSELRAYLRVRRQFWPNKQRCDLYLPPTKSPAYKLLLKQIYKSSHKKLQKYWNKKQFSGDIATKPSHVSSYKAAGTLVLKNARALTVVPANRVPKGARVLLIDGKKPGDAGYALSGKTKKKK
ncbi:MAG: hypothetical protein ACYTGZ_12420 [Planctomycetota bacterium]|jgi:hypothetical protein